MSLRAQFAVRKQGSLSSGNWSTRTLTIDTATSTATVSRHHHPNNVLYHSVEVRMVLLWPRFDESEIDDDFQSLKAKMTIQIVGKEVPVPRFSCDGAAATPSITTATNTTPDTTLLSPLSTPGAGGSFVSEPSRRTSTDFAFLAADASKKPRQLKTEATDNLYESWILRFTSIEAYEAAVRMFGALRKPDGSLRKVMPDSAAEDLQAVKNAWATRYVRNVAVAAQTPGTVPRSAGKTAVSSSS